MSKVTVEGPVGADVTQIDTTPQFRVGTKLVQQEVDLRAVLTKYGITDNDKQEEIITKYLAFLVEIGG